MKCAGYKSDYELTNDTLYLALRSGYGVSPEYLGENGCDTRRFDCISKA